jgi:sterol 3beta-glucosyltransferase
VITIDQVAHSWLFPRVDVTVHHGGAGTTGAALTAGRPTVVVPFGADQPFWGQRAHALGVAPAPIPRRHLTAVALERALSSALGDGDMRERARALGVRLSAEQGTQRAIDELEGILRSRR